MIEMVIYYGGSNNYIWSKYCCVFSQKVLEELGVDNSGRYRSNSCKVQHYGTHVSIMNRCCVLFGMN